MTQAWRLLVAAAVVCATVGSGTAAAQTVLARRVPSGETLEVMMNGRSVGTAAPDAVGDATVTVNMRQAIGKSEIDANLYVDHCDTVHRVWIVEVGGPLPAEGTCELRAVSGLYWVRPVNTIVVSDVTAAVPSILLLKGSYTPPAPGEEPVSSAPREFPAGLVLFGGGGYIQTTDFSVPACGDVSACTGDEGGIGFTAGAEYRFNRVLSAEFSFIKPPPAKANGSETTFRFDSKQQANAFTLAGKIAAPVGLARIYGKGGALYHQAKLETTQAQDPRTVTVDDQEVTIPGGTQTITLKTDGWGWIFGGGLEIWPSHNFALYMEATYGAIKGKDVNGGEARIDNRLGSGIVGLRVLIGK